MSGEVEVETKVKMEATKKKGVSVRLKNDGLVEEGGTMMTI